MARVQVSRLVAAPAPAVWAVLTDLEGQARWMVDVVAVHLTSPTREGVGTSYDCVTRLGPVRMTIPMEIVEWQPGRRMATRYDGTLAGGGSLTVARRGRHRTRVTWRARVHIPWWLGGPLGGFAAARVLGLVWRRNLDNLAGLVEGGGRPTRRVTPGGWTRGRTPRPRRPLRARR